MKNEYTLSNDTSILKSGQREHRAARPEHTTTKKHSFTISVH